MSKLGLRLHADEEHWIPLSDLMTGLMFLFLVIALAYMVAAELKHQKPTAILRGYAASRAQLYSDLKASLGPDLQRWHASVDPTTLSVRFSGNTGLFHPGSAQLTPQFQSALNSFFPRYVAVLAQNRAAISEVRIEGYTSTRGAYLENMALSQERARNVLAYVTGFASVKPDLPWLSQVVSADGFSSSHIVRAANGREDAAASDRVEFHVLSDANAKIAAALRVSPTTAPAGVKATPTPLPPPTFDASLPPYPAWASSLIGVAVAKAYPHTAVRCFGYLDSVTGEYTGSPGGAEVSGWAFDMNAWQPIARVIVADTAGKIIGAADGGVPRPDVQQSLGWITSPDTGWHGSVAATKGPVSVWAVMPAAGTVCPLHVAPEPARQRL